MDSHGQQEKDEVTENIVDVSDNSDIDTLETTESQSADLGKTNTFTKQQRVIPDDKILGLLICNKEKCLILYINGGGILLLAPTGVTGTTIHSGLGINVKGNLHPLREQHRAALRNK